MLARVNWRRFEISRPVAGLYWNRALRRIAKAMGPSFGILRGKARTGGTIKSRNLLWRDGAWHRALTVACEPKREGGTQATAADCGLEKRLRLVKSDGPVDHVQNPRGCKASQARLVALDRAVSRRQRGSKAWRRAKRASARFKAKIAGRRLDQHHQLGWRIAFAVAVIASEKLRVQNMTASGAGTVEQPGSMVAQKSGAIGDFSIRRPRC